MTIHTHSQLGQCDSNLDSNKCVYTKAVLRLGY